MKALLLLAMGFLFLWLDVLTYRWLRKRWPTFAKVVLVFWLLNLVVTLYRLVNRKTDDLAN